MPIPRLHPDSTALLVIDIQDRLMPTIHNVDLLVTRCRALIGGAALLKMPIIVTEQYVKGLGHTFAPVLEVVPPGTPVLEKMSMCAFCNPCSTAVPTGFKRFMRQMRFLLASQIKLNQHFGVWSGLAASQRELSPRFTN